jgi:hypothetical protein
MGVRGRDGPMACGLAGHRRRKEGTGQVSSPEEATKAPFALDAAKSMDF